jgi:transcriptional regulator with XRE-family HTH domain
VPEFGLVIKRLRRARRWTQEQLAAEGGFEQGSISL